MTAQISDEELAYHEAGHSVLHVLLGGTITRVSIELDEPGRGVRVASFGDPPPTDAAAVHDRIVVLLGGAAAQYLRNPTAPRPTDANDSQRAEALAATISDQPASVLEADWQRAVTMLQTPENWNGVERLAQLLVTRRVLDGDEVQRVIRGEPQ